MTVGIDLIETVGQYRHRRIAVGECLTMGTDIDTVGQTADDEYRWAQRPQISDETADQVLSVGGHPTGSDDADDLLLVQIGIAGIVEDDWSVRTFLESLGVVVAGEGEASDTVFLHEAELRFCPFHRIIPVLQRLRQAWGCFFDNVANVISVFIQQLCTSHGLVQGQCLLEVEVRQACQRHCVKDFLFHILFLFTVYGLQFTDDYLVYAT